MKKTEKTYRSLYQTLELTAYLIIIYVFFVWALIESPKFNNSGIILRQADKYLIYFTGFVIWVMGNILFHIQQNKILKKDLSKRKN